MSRKYTYILLILLILVVLAVIGLMRGWFKSSPVNTTTAPQELTIPVETETNGESENVRDILGFNTELSFAHVAPGEYSEIYVRIPSGGSGRTVTVTLQGPTEDAVANPQKTVKTGEDGIAAITFRVYKYGTYTVTPKIDDWIDKPVTITVE